MALIEIQHVVADMYPVDPDWAGTPDLIEGQIVRLTTAGYARPDASNNNDAIGIAGDTQSNDTAGTPYSASLIVNSAGATRQTSNRVSDFFNETLASGKMTVYNGGGRFATDQFEDLVSTANPGAALYSSANALLTTNGTPGTDQLIGRVAAAVADYPSGVPGITVDGSTTLGEFVEFILLI
jgi:hypothetical protein